MATRTVEQSAEFVRELLKYALEVRGLAQSAYTRCCLTQEASQHWYAEERFLVSTVGAQDLLTQLSGCLLLQGMHVQQLVCIVPGLLTIWGF